MNNTAHVGAAVKTFFDFKEDSKYPNIMKNNMDSFNQAMSFQHPSYYLFSFYDVIIDKEISTLDELSEWASNSSRTVIISVMTSFKFCLEACFHI